jgi:hypothetical protein
MRAGSLAVLEDHAVLDVRSLRATGHVLTVVATPWFGLHLLTITAPESALHEADSGQVNVVLAGSYHEVAVGPYPLVAREHVRRAGHWHYQPARRLRRVSAGVATQPARVLRVTGPRRPRTMCTAFHHPGPVVAA